MLAAGEDADGRLGAADLGASADARVFDRPFPIRSAQLPLIGASFMVATIATTFFLTYSNDHVYPAGALPAISETGMYAPESAFFSLGLTLVSVCLAAAAYLVYALLDARGLQAGAPIVLPLKLTFERTNMAALVIGLAASLLLALLANFSLRDFFISHNIFAACFFTAAFVQAMLSTWLLKRSAPGGQAVKDWPETARFWMRWKESCVMAIGLILYALPILFNVLLGIAVRNPSEALQKTAHSLQQYALVLALVLYVVGWRFELRQVSMRLIVSLNAAQ